MGSDPAADTNSRAEEKPQHVVSIVQFFAIGRYPVTFAEFDQFTEAAGLEKANDYGQGCNCRPVIGVDWYDAVRYTAWLSQKSGRDYRLSTEAEWEYAVRAGTNTPWFWGVSPDLADKYVWHRSNSGEDTQPVGGKEPNYWELHDMIGNVWEWVEDDWHDCYEGAPNEGAPWLQEQGQDRDRKPRVMRGGCWGLAPSDLRCALRSLNFPKDRNRDVGFRLVCCPPSRVDN